VAWGLGLDDSFGLKIRRFVNRPYLVGNDFSSTSKRIS